MKKKSGKRGSNPRPSAWKADALSTELLPRNICTKRLQTNQDISLLKGTSRPVCILSLNCCGQRWIRTTEGVSQQIYSLPHLATLVFALIHYFRKRICDRLTKLPCLPQIRASCRIRTNDPEITNHVLWPTELKRHRNLLFGISCLP